MTAHRSVPADPEALLAFAVEAARRASRAITAVRDGRRSLRTKSSPTDPVTAADLAAHTAVRDLLAAGRPLDGLVSEEDRDVESGNGIRWVMDPLDGTVNYLHGLPHFAVSIACEAAVGADWEAVVAVVRDVTTDEQFTAVRGAGSRLDGVEITVSDPVPPDRAVIATEFGYRPETRRRQAAMVDLLAPRVAGLRATGSAAIDLCWTAAGLLDGYVEDELGRWDWAAGRLIVQEAGGRVSDLHEGVLAAGPHLHDELRHLLAPG